MSNIAIITARGGSKRIPKKNIKDFCGKPIISYSIEAAISSGIFDEVMVSTDDDEIAEVSRICGASIPFFRSARTSDDYATTTDVLMEVLDEYYRMNRYFKIGCCIYPTAPFVSGKKLKEAYDMFVSSGAESLVPVVRFSYPPQRAYVEKDGFLQFRFPKYITSRSQDLEPMFHDAGQFYYFNVETFMNSGSILTGRITKFELPEIEAQDIDNEMDWKIAEIKYSLTNKAH